MRKVWLLSLAAFGASGFALWMFQTLLPSIPVSSQSMPTAVPSSSSASLPIYRQYQVANSEIHTLSIPAQGRSSLRVAMSETTDRVENFAKANGTRAVLNAGFFDPVNAKTTSYIVSNGKLVADPRQNERLIQNPKLQPYLAQILNRSEFRRYQCGQTIRYTIEAHQTGVPSNCQLIDAIGGGPRLLPRITSAEEGFVDAATGRDAIGATQPNARSAIGIKPDDTVLLVMAAQKPDAPANSGVSLQTLASFMKELGVEQALNLDGGTSSALFYQGKTAYGKVDKDGKSIQRPVKSVVFVSE